jgi:ribose transport system substrate-binding protein
MSQLPSRRMRRWITPLLVAALILAACGDDDDATAPDDDTEDDGNGVAGESVDADPELLELSLGTSDTEAVPEVILAAVARAGEDVSEERLEVAMECWQEAQCNTGTGGDLSVALADGFGENVWREVTRMEFILQALTYPEIGEIRYTTAQGDTQKAISDFQSLIAQDVDIIATFPDAGEALLPTAREATRQDIVVVPYIAGLSEEAGEDYLTYVAEDLCELGNNFAEVLNEEVGEGKVAFLGGTPGNPLSEAWQSCEEESLSDDLELVGRADTNWTREGTLQAMSGFLSQHPDLAGISYEYADGFLGGVRAYEAADMPINLVLTLRTDEVGVFCEREEADNPDFRIFHSSGGSFQSRIALTAAMMQLNGESVEDRIVVPAEMREVDENSCREDIPGEAPISTLIPDNVMQEMYGSGS